MILLLRFALVLLSASAAFAGEVRIKKVLHHLVDAKGRTSLAPSLFERDAYQVHLRDNPELVASSRFEVHYKAERSRGPVLLRMEIRGSKTGLGQARTFEKDVLPARWLASWTRLELDQAASESIGTVIAWRATLWRGGEMLAEQQSFLW
jgi:hypothetical protein